MTLCTQCSKPLVIAASKGGRWLWYHQDPAFDEHRALVDDPGVQDIAVLARRLAMASTVISVGCHTVLLDHLLADLLTAIAAVQARRTRSPLVLAVEQPLPSWMAACLGEYVSGPVPDTVPEEWTA